MNSQDMKKPTGGVTLRRVMELPGPKDHLHKELWVKIYPPKEDSLPY